MGCALPRHWCKRLFQCRLNTNGPEETVDVNECSSQRREVFFTGNVQGVGFRYTAQRVAAGYAVTGFVRNLRDGRVQIVLEGQSQQIDSFLASLQARMGGYVRNMTATEVAPTGEFSSFEVRF